MNAMTGDGARALQESPPVVRVSAVEVVLRFFAASMVWVCVLFLINNVLIFWWGWPGVSAFLQYIGLTESSTGDAIESASAAVAGGLQTLSYIVLLGLLVRLSTRGGAGALEFDAKRYAGLAAFVVRAAFWGAVLVGLADAFLSFLRVEGLMASVFGAELDKQLSLPIFRGNYVHVPLLAVGVLIACFTRSLSFIWLAVLVVFAELQIVIFRFVFSYEQAFMGDLVRFWYAGLFLFASAYNLVDEGHVRVDVLYSQFSARGKAWANAAGSLLLGLPLCWTILCMGLWTKGSSLNSPLLSFEITQSGYGMYVKYLMAAFLIVFAVSMIMQFSSYLLSSSAVLLSGIDDDGSDSELKNRE